jgi:hypothetical protein
MNPFFFILAFFMHLKALLEAALILIFGYFIPIIETLATVKPPSQNTELAQEKIDSLVGMWAGVIIMEAILVPVAGDHAEQHHVGPRLPKGERRPRQSLLLGGGDS